MNKEEILRISQSNKMRGAEYENRVSAKSALYGSLVAMIIGVILFVLQYCIEKTVNIGLIAVGMTASGVQSLIEGIKTKKSILTIFGSVQLSVALIAILSFVGGLVAK